MKHAYRNLLLLVSTLLTLTFTVGCKESTFQSIMKARLGAEDPQFGEGNSEGTSPTPTPTDSPTLDPNVTIPVAIPPDDDLTSADPTPTGTPSAEVTSTGTQNPTPTATATPTPPNVTTLFISREPDRAWWTNCLWVVVDPKTALDAKTQIMCNKDPQTTVKTITLPNDGQCHTLRLEIRSNGKDNFSTDNLAFVYPSTELPNKNIRDLSGRRGIYIQKNLQHALYWITGNDNGDEDSYDFAYRIMREGKTRFTIENAGYACD
jgi:hypothetical protein